MGSFEKILDTASDSSTSLSHEGEIPDLSDVIMHLKLLQSFRKLKDLVTVGVDNSVSRDKLWQCYLTIAVRRFTIFVSALNLSFHDRQSLADFVDSVLPPIDIILVWHSFLLNPKSFYDNFKTNDFTAFSKYMFPLDKITHEISNEDFVYSPSIEIIDDFTLFIEDFFIKSSIRERFNYNSYQPFDPSAIDLVILCPNCHKKLPKCDLTNSDSTGFADALFQLKFKCCQFNSLVTHDELRRRKLYTDCLKVSKIPSVIKHYSREINKPWAGVSAEAIDSNIKDQTLASYYNGLNILDFSNSKYHYSDLLVLRDYLELNPIYMTIPTRIAFPIHEDLVTCIKRQEVFIDKMVELNWLMSPCIKETVLESIQRYIRFFSLIKDSNHGVVPTLDIDLIWHTHQLFQNKYFKYYRKISGSIVDHNDKIEVNRLDTSFAKTCKLYKEKFKQDYSICFCWYCTVNRSGRFAILRRFGVKPSELIVEDGSVSNSHISCHNLVEVPTERSRIFDKRLRSRYKLQPQDSMVRPLPWERISILDPEIGRNYITEPGKPPRDSFHTNLYKNGLCLTAFDTASSCGGLRGGCGYFEEFKASCVGKGVSADPSFCGAGPSYSASTRNRP